MPTWTTWGVPGHFELQRPGLKNSNFKAYALKRTTVTVVIKIVSDSFNSLENILLYQQPSVYTDIICAVYINKAQIK